MYHAVVGLRIDADLVRAMKIQALKENRTLQDITRDLWVEYLQKVIDDSQMNPQLAAFFGYQAGMIRRVTKEALDETT